MSGISYASIKRRMSILHSVLSMCLSIPGKVASITGDTASVDYGEFGQRQNVNISLIDVKIGNYVLVQGGFAIRVLSDQEAQETLDTWRMVRELQEGS